MEFLFCWCAPFHFCHLYHSEYQFHWAPAPFDRSEHQKYVCDDKKRMDFSAQKRIAVHVHLFIFLYLCIYTLEWECVYAIYLDLCIHVCMYINIWHTHWLKNPSCYWSMPSLCFSNSERDLGPFPQQGQSNTVKHYKKASHACSKLCFGCSAGIGTSYMVLGFPPPKAFHLIKI